VSERTETAQAGQVIAWVREITHEDGVVSPIIHTPKLHAELIDLATPEEYEYLTSDEWKPVYRGTHPDSLAAAVLRRAFVHEGGFCKFHRGMGDEQWYATLDAKYVPVSIEERDAILGGS
jgi:hypothetical protein